MNIVKSYLRKAKLMAQYYQYLQPIEKSNATRDNLSSGTNIALFTSARGGSTWLAQIMNAIPDSAIVWEPLFLGGMKYKELKNVNFWWNQHIPQDADWPEAEVFFQKLFNRQILHPKLYQYNDLSKAADWSYYIFKFCLGNMMMPWLVDRFEIKPVLMLRHPCAVVASQFKHGGFSHLVNETSYEIPACRYPDMYEKHKEAFAMVRTPEERFAAEWAMTAVYPVHHPYNDKKWITISYEQLYLNIEEEISKLFARLELELPQDVLSIVRKPSHTTNAYALDKIKKGSQVDSWRKHLTNDQIKNILRITNAFGVDFYDESSEPDYAKIQVK